MKLAPLLQIGRGVTAIIGGGGKTTLMETLAEELSKKGKVIDTVQKGYVMNDKVIRHSKVVVGQ